MASQQLTDQKKQLRYSEYAHIELTEIEEREAILYFKMLKSRDIEQKLKEEQKKLKMDKMKSPWNYDELRAEIINRTKLLPFDFILDKDNERVFHLLCLYFSGDERFNQEEMVFADGTKIKLSLKKGIGLISPQKGNGKTVLMNLFQSNKYRPYFQLDTKYVSAMFNTDGEVAITKHSEPLHFAPMPNYFYRDKIGICFEDLGFELAKNSWGNKSDVMADVLFAIYSKNQIGKDFSNFHFTSNLSGKEFGERYDDRIRDRMREMFNVILMPGGTRRK
jgi:hypothetical protein